MTTIFTPRRVRLYPLAILLGALVGFSFFVGTSRGLETFRGGRMGGDFPAFYGAARIVRFGDPRDLYNAARQREAQRDLLPGVEDGWIHFAYPPHVALLYVPFTLLTFKAAYLLHTALMVACCAAALALLRRKLSALRHYYVPALAMTLTFYPLFRAIAGGQNTSISLLCAAGAAVAAAQGRDLLAGIWLGAWLFKPQLALPVTAAIVLSGRPRVLSSFAVVAVAWYAIAASMTDAFWPIQWWQEGVVPFAVMDRLMDRPNAVSFATVTSDIGVPWLGAVLIVATVALTVFLALRLRDDQPSLVACATAAAVLVSPHALYYDGGLAILGLLVLTAYAGEAVLPHVAFLWLLAAAQLGRQYSPLPPVMLVLIGTMWLAARASVRRSGVGHPE